MAFESHPRPTADQMTWFIGDMEQSVQLHPGQVYSSLSDIYSLFIPDEFSYKFDTVLYEFLETGISDITFKGRDQELK